MAVKAFNTAALVDFDDGAIRNHLERQFRLAVNDCMERPAEDRVRKVLLQFELKPVQNVHTGELVNVQLQYQINGKYPSTKAVKIYTLGVKKGGQLTFDFADEGEAS